MSLPNHHKKLIAIQPHEDLRQAVEVQAFELKPPQPNEVIVKTYYAGVNASDYLMVQGRYARPTPPPFDMGLEACGAVVAVGSAVKHLKEGDYVLGLLEQQGGYSDYFRLNALYAIPIPQATAEMIVLGVSGLTASIGLSVVGEMKSNETVLVTAAAGGTGNLATQLAILAGNHVIGTCSSDDKVEFLKRIGCHRPINYRTEQVKSILEQEYPEGINLMFEGVGGEMYDLAVKALAVKGRMVITGTMSEYEAGIQPVTAPRVSHELLRRSASLRGLWLVHYLQEAPAHIQRLHNLVEEGKLALIVDDGQFTGFTGAIEAIECMYAGKNVGKLVVDFTTT